MRRPSTRFLQAVMPVTVSTRVSDLRLGLALRRSMVIALAVLVAPRFAQAQAPTGELRLTGRGFAPNPAPQYTEGYEAIVVARASFFRRWDSGDQSLAVEPFVRLHTDGVNHRIDFRALSWSLARDDWELQLGLREVFWGVTESGNPVDVINQRDPEVAGRGYSKLGQPLVQVTGWLGWGTVDLLLMPLFRERSYRGAAGALWAPQPVDDSQPVFQRGSRYFRPAAALRWSQRLAAWDLGLAYLRGTSREPWFAPGKDRAGREVLIPHYDEVDQLVIDGQLTVGSWLWKLEATTLDPQTGRYVAVVGGLEYAFADYFSVYLEYLFDSRGHAATTSFEDDLYAGARLLLPGGTVEVAGYVDRESLNAVVVLSASRRLSEATTLALEGRVFQGRSTLEPGHARRHYNALALTFTRYF